QPTGDDGQDAGGMDGFGHEVHDVRREETHDDFDRAIIDVDLDPFDDASNDQTDADARGNQVEQSFGAGRQGGRLPADDHRGRELEGEQPGRVVHQAFAFKDIDDATREAQA